MAGLRSSRQTLTPNSSDDKDFGPLIPADQFSPARSLQLASSPSMRSAKRSASFLRSSKFRSGCLLLREGLLVYRLCVPGTCTVNALLFSVVLRNSVQERGLWCTEYAFGAKKGLLVYATRFQRHSVQKTGSWCTEGKFGTGEGLLVYRTHLRKRKKRPSGVRDAFSEVRRTIP